MRLSSAKVNNELSLDDKLSVDTTELQKILGCGRPTAVEIGSLAGARIEVGKRLLWNVNKVKKYLDNIATE